MRKQSKRRIRPASEPAMIRLAANPEIGISERQAINAMRGGWANYQNSYRILADCHGVLTIGLHRKGDHSMDGVLKLAMIALLNIFDRMKNTGKVGATGDEMSALEIMLDCSEDFWKRQSSTALEIAILTMRRVREQQIKERKAA